MALLGPHETQLKHRCSRSSYHSCSEDHAALHDCGETFDVTEPVRVADNPDGVNLLAINLEGYDVVDGSRYADNETGSPLIFTCSTPTWSICLRATLAMNGQSAQRRQRDGGLSRQTTCTCSSGGHLLQIACSSTEGASSDAAKSSALWLGNSLTRR